MRVGIACYSSYGGSGVVATELGAALASRGHKVHFISASMPFRLAGRRLGGNIFFHEVDEVDYPLFSGPLYTLSLASKIHQIALAEKLDIIHAHYAIPHAAGAWLGQQILGGKIKLVTTLHGTDITLVGKAPSFRPVVRFVIDQSDAVTTVSEWLAGETRRTFGVDRHIEVVHNFIDPERFKRAPDPEFRARFAAPDEKIVLHVSNFRPVKRAQDVVKAFAGIVGSGVKAKLLMVGDGPTRGCAADLARELGVMDRAWFLGKADPIEDFFSIADLFLFPSEYESFGLAALEAMCAEIPVVASEGGGLPEVIRRGETGFLRPVGDFEGMAADGVAILRDPEAARAMGARAREDVIERFAMDKIIPRYEALYASLLDPAHPEFEPCEESLMASGL